jgi:aquaporin Z
MFLPLRDPLVTDTRAPEAFAPVAIGLSLTLIHLISIPINSTFINPARSSGVACFDGNAAPGQLWLFWLVPIVGSAMAGTTYAIMTGEHRERREDREVAEDASAA